MLYNDKIDRGEKIIVHIDSELKALIPGFLEDWKEEVRFMWEALEKKDYETIRKLGHDMKGIGGSCSLEVITYRGRDLEEAAKAMDQEMIRKNLNTLSYYLERVEFEYE